MLNGTVVGCRARIYEIVGHGKTGKCEVPTHGVTGEQSIRCTSFCAARKVHTYRYR